MLKCVYCSYSETKVIDKRDSDNLNIIKRRRECLKCSKRFSTFEKVEHINLLVEKKDNRVEQFNSDKLKAGVLIACEKRIPKDKVEALVRRIETKLRKLKTNTVKSNVIGQEVLRTLKAVDTIAYLRFASVYKDFNDISSFQEELQLLNKKSR